MASGANPGTGKQLMHYYFNFMLFVTKKRQLSLFVYIHLYILAGLVLAVKVEFALDANTVRRETTISFDEIGSLSFMVLKWTSYSLPRIAP